MFKPTLSSRRWRDQSGRADRDRQRITRCKSGSPALDAGSDDQCTDEDQAGTARPAGDACDIGAHEKEEALQISLQQAVVEDTATATAVTDTATDTATVTMTETETPTDTSTPTVTDTELPTDTRPRLRTRSCQLTRHTATDDRLTSLPTDTATATMTDTEVPTDTPATATDTLTPTDTPTLTVTDTLVPTDSGDCDRDNYAHADRDEHTATATDTLVANGYGNGDCDRVRRLQLARRQRRTLQQRRSRRGTAASMWDQRRIGSSRRATS